MKNPEVSRAAAGVVDGRGLDLRLTKCEVQFRQMATSASVNEKPHASPG